jgi:hypothetical protein
MRRRLKNSYTFSVFKGKLPIREQTSGPSSQEPHIDKIKRNGLFSKVQDVEVVGRYHYTPLNSRGEIRLLRILPGEHWEPMCVAIDHAAFHAPEHEDPEREEWSTELRQGLKDALSPKWSVEETMDGQFLFCNNRTGLTQWEPPDANAILAKGM